MERQKLNTQINDLNQFIFINFLTSAFFFVFYILLTSCGIKEFIFLIPAYFSTLFLIYIVIYLVSLLLYAIPYLNLPLLILFFSLLHISTIIDLSIYKIFRYHINSMVINLILTPGGLDTLDQPLYMKIFFTLLSAVIVYFETFIFLRIKRGKIKFTNRISFKKIIFTLILFTFIDKSISAYAILKDKIWITKNFEVFPLYMPLSMRKFAEEKLNINVERDKIQNEINSINSQLNYPRKKIRIENPHKYNILFVIADSMRFDMFNREIMPNTYKFAKDNKAFILRNHYSGGNATRFGIFSIFYGLYGNYWFKMQNERKGPVFINLLKNLNYNFSINASARLTYPEFDRTVFVDIDKNDIYDKPEAKTKWEKDILINKKLINFLKSKKQPFMGFVFYDSPHGSYEYQPEFEKFKPAHFVDHIFLNKKNIKPMFNKYKNSIYFIDSLIEEIIKTLKNEKLLKNTIVIITGDHGEPFFEQGYYGHNTGYCKYEVKVPLILYIPDKSGGEINYMTSHMDIVPTVLKLIGVKNSEEDFSHGINIFNTEKLKSRRFVTVFSWNTAAIITDKLTLVYPFSTYRFDEIKIYDSQTYNDLTGSYSLKDFSEELKLYYRNLPLFIK